MDLRAREAHAQGKPVARDCDWVPYARISANLKKAVIVTEDGAFWQHEGMDYEQLRESMETNWERGEFARGASTITQQLAKNLYLLAVEEPDPESEGDADHRRLEVELSKQRILEIYLNSIEWGDGVWGAEAAARRYFHKSAAELTRLRGRAAGGRDRQSAHPRSRASERAPAPAAADDHAPDGRGHPAAGGRPSSGSVAASRRSAGEARPGGPDGPPGCTRALPGAAGPRSPGGPRPEGA